MDDLLSRHFISLFLIFLFAIRLSSQRTTRDKVLRYFWLTVVSCFLLIVEDQLEIAASLDPSMRFWRTLLSIAGYSLRTTAIVGLVFVVCRPEQRNKLIWWVPCIINVLVCMTAFFTDIAFGFDETYKFYRGPLGYVAFIVPIFYLCSILYLTFRYYVDHRRKTDRLILITCALLCLLSALLDSTRGGVRLHEAIMISSIFFYLFLRSYDVRRDSLTSVLNRQSLYDDCESMKKSICAAASVDMNGLKVLNDTRGHQAGDMALKKIGECLRKPADQNIRAYRIGGDEFILLFFHQDEIMVRETLSRIRKNVEEAGYSVACGYAMRENANEDPTDLILRSDMKMFEQKAQYYREKQHDRRRNRREGTERYPQEKRQSLEDSPQPVAVFRFNEHRQETLAVSDGFCSLFGYESREQAVHILDQEMYSDVHPDDRERLSGANLRFSEGEELDVVYRTRKGMESDYRVIHARGIHLHTDTGERIAHVWYMDEGVYREGDETSGTLMTQALNRALHEESILNATHFDELTGLPTLTWFFRLSEAGKTAQVRDGRHGALLYIDLSGMKMFNNKYGFAEGDKLLKAFGTVLVKIFGKDCCCHIAADRFAAVTTDDRLEENLRCLFDEAAKANDGNALPVRVGIYSTGLEDVSITTAFDRAKMACDEIRQSDVSGWNMYKEAMRDAHRKRQYIEANIERAIREGWIRVCYQPIVRAEDGTVCDEEALARWDDPTEGLLSPADFIPCLENAGIIYKLDLYILEQALEKIRRQQAAGIKVVPHSINLSRSDFEVCDIVEEIRKRADAAGISHDLITVEITESIIGRDFDFMNEQINRFRQAGFAIWMDDFGTGYSSLEVLQNIDFDLIKFDMSFTRKLDEGENGRIILTELMKMAILLHKDTICEGIEKEEHVRFLRGIGCSKLQGYYFGRPVPWEPVADGNHETETED